MPGRSQPEPATLSANGVKKTLAGLWGEVIAGEILAERGFSVSWIGGNGAHRDLIASSEQRPLVLDVSVKASTSENGRIAWGKPGIESVCNWVDQAQERGRVPVLLLLHLDAASVVATVANSSRMTVSRPTLLAVTIIHATAWGELVDRRRTSYAAEPYKRGPKEGTLRPASGCLYPAFVEDGESLDEFFGGLLRN